MLTLIAAGTGKGFKLNAGQLLKVVDPEGGQICDLMAYTPDGLDRLHNGRTFDYNSKVTLSTGDALWSSASKKMLTIIADEVGRHDFLYAACSLEMYQIQYGVKGHHPNCTENLTGALQEHGITPGLLPTPFNIFQNASIVDGELVLAAPLSKPGQSITLRAEMDLVIALSACPASVCNGGGATKPVAFEVIDPA
ncbi:DUF1989 domain-containing protein [Pseudomonas sp. TE21394]